MRSFISKLALVCAALSIVACDNLNPCTNCPKLEGTWVFGYTPGSASGTCSGVTFPPQPGTLDFTRAGARIYTTASGIRLEGTIYEDNTFSMHGDSVANADGGSSRIELRGAYLASASGSDGGTDGGARASSEQLRGTYTQVQRAQAGQDDCRSPAEFTAVR